MKQKINIHKFAPLVLLLICILMLTSCTSESLTTESNSPVNVKFNFSLSGDTRSLSSANENTINTVMLMAFNSNGVLAGSKYVNVANYEEISMVLNTGTYNIYAIANTKEITGVTKLDDLKGKYATIALAADLDSADAAIMEGSTSAVTISANTSNEVSIPMSHLCSKLNFTITPMTGITITGYRLCHVPLSCNYILQSDKNNPGGNYASFDAVTKANTDSLPLTNICYYVYENLAGSNDNCTTAQLRDSIKAPKSSSYLEVYARAQYWHTTYRIYLGDDINKKLTDFNIARNKNYSYNISISNSGEKDARAIYAKDELKTGALLYEDGTWGDYDPNIMPVAIIFSVSTSSKDKDDGYTHGYAMALKDASGTFAWGPYGTGDDVSGLTNVTTTNALIADKNGRTESNVINSSIYPAAYAATTTYNSTVSAPSGTSGWYLPSIGQWFDICVNLGGMSPSGYSSGGPSLRWGGQASTCADNINSKLQNVGYDAFAEDNIYWSSSEYSDNTAYGVNFNISDLSLGYYYKYRSFKVRPVIAF